MKNVITLLISIIIAGTLLRAQENSSLFAAAPVEKYSTGCAGAVNKQADIYGIQETRDVAALFFKAYETYLKASSDGEVNFTDIPYLLGPAMLLLPAFSGAGNIPNELLNLSDDELKTLLLTADDYDLGQNAVKAKQVFKTMVVLAQTLFLLTKPAI